MWQIDSSKQNSQLVQPNTPDWIKFNKMKIL